MKSYLLALLPLAAAHFTLDQPATIGFSDDDEPNGPCGGMTPGSKDTLHPFNVNGDWLAMDLHHPAGNWLVRATLDETAASGLAEIHPIFRSEGAGSVCTKVSVPSSWAGKNGIIQVLVDTSDGQLWQCTHVTFGNEAVTQSSMCLNATNVKVGYIKQNLDTVLAPLATLTAVDSGMGGMGSMGTTTAAGAASTAATTTTSAADSGLGSAMETTTSASPTPSLNAAAKVDSAAFAVLGGAAMIGALLL